MANKFQVPKLFILGYLLCGTFDGTTFTKGDDPGGIGSDIVLIPTTTLAPTGGTATTVIATAVGRNALGQEIRAFWTQEQLIGRVAGVQIPPIFVALTSAPATPLIMGTATDTQRRFVCVDSLIFATIAQAFEIRTTQIGDIVAGITDYSLEDAPETVDGSTAGPYTSRSGQGQGSKSISITLEQKTDLDVQAFLKSMERRYKSSVFGVSTKTSIYRFDFSGTWEIGDIVLAYIDGVRFTSTLTAATAADAATKIAAAITAALPTNVASAIATGAALVVTSTAGKAVDIQVYSTDAAVAAADAQVITATVSQLTDFEYQQTQYSKRRFTRIEIQELNDTGCTTFFGELPYVHIMDANESGSLGEYYTLEVTGKVLQDHRGLVERRA